MKNHGRGKSFTETSVTKHRDSASFQAEVLNKTIVNLRAELDAVKKERDEAHAMRREMKRNPDKLLSDEVGIRSRIKNWDGTCFWPDDGKKLIKHVDYLRADLDAVKKERDQLRQLILMVRAFAGFEHYEWCDLTRGRPRTTPPLECDCGPREFKERLAAWEASHADK